MKTLKLIINALLILLMAIYGLAMLALPILPFVDVANPFPRAEGPFDVLAFSQVQRFITFLVGVTGWSQSYNLPSILP